jgi:HAD superfamily hydrolase (TIGR01509 family)
VRDAAIYVVRCGMIDAALFDWDGTLLDSRETLLGAWHAATESVLGKRFPATAEEEELVFTLPGSQLFPHVAGDADLAPRLAAAFHEAYEAKGDLVRPFAGVVELLGRLRAAGLRIAVVTSKARRRYDMDAAQIGVDGLVDVAVCQEDTRAHKPDAAPVLYALRALGVLPEAAVLVGDTPVDVAAGTAAGTRVVGAAWGAAGERALLDAGASTVVRDARELAEIVLGADTKTERSAT